MEHLKTCNFVGINCYVQKSYYQNSQIRLQLLATDHRDNLANGIFLGEDIATATVSLANVSVGKNQALIKDYSENSGVLKALIDSKIISPVISTISTGFTEVPIVEVLI